MVSSSKVISLTIVAALALGVAMIGCIPEPALAPDELMQEAEDLPCDGAPLKVDEGYALVPVYLSGYEEAFLFLLDTGAGRSLITPSTRRVAQIDRIDTDDSTLIGATGEEQHTSYVVDSIRVGSFTRYEMDITEVDLYRFHQSEIEYAGVLGNDFLRHVNIEYNLPERRICFYEAPNEPEHVALESFKRVPFYQQMSQGGFITFAVYIGGERARALFDTGSSHTVFNSLAAQQDGAVLDQIPVQSETFGIGVGEATATRLYTFSDLQARDVTFQPQQISIADLPIFDVLQRTSRPFILLGNDLIRHRIVYIQYSSRELFFSEPMPSP